MAEERPAVSVVVPAYNSAATIGRTLEALAAQDLDRPYEVIVVDDGSEDGTVAIAERAPVNVTVLRQDHRGAAAARNYGGETARGDVLAFTDSDCYPVGGWLAAGLAALRDADLVQGAVGADPNARRGPYDRTLWVERESGLYETANLFVTRELFADHGGFEQWMSDQTGRPMGEDVWFGWRVRRSGARTAFAPDALVHHEVFSSGPREFAAERLRQAYVPAMTRKIPELRRTYCFGRLFLSSGTAAFDLALAGAVTAAAASSALPLLALGPYLWTTGRRALRWGRLAPGILASSVVADSVGFAALVWGSLRWRSPVL